MCLDPNSRIYTSYILFVPRTWSRPNPVLVVEREHVRERAARDAEGNKSEQ